MARKPKTRNAGTMTEAAFWGAIRSCLRRKFQRFGKQGWLPATQAIARQTRRVGRADFIECQGCHSLVRKNPPKGTKKGWQLHHVIACGATNPDTEGFVNRLFQEDSDLFMTLCTECHDTTK